MSFSPAPSNMLAITFGGGTAMLTTSSRVMTPQDLRNNTEMGSDVLPLDSAACKIYLDNLVEFPLLIGRSSPVEMQKPAAIGESDLPPPPTQKIAAIGESDLPPPPTQKIAAIGDTDVPPTQKIAASGDTDIPPTQKIAASGDTDVLPPPQNRSARKQNNSQSQNRPAHKQAERAFSGKSDAPPPSQNRPASKQNYSPASKHAGGYSKPSDASLPGTIRIMEIVSLCLPIFGCVATVGTRRPIPPTLAEMAGVVKNTFANQFPSFVITRIEGEAPAYVDTNEQTQLKMVVFIYGYFTNPNPDKNTKKLYVRATTVDPPNTKPQHDVPVAICGYKFYVKANKSIVNEHIIPDTSLAAYVEMTFSDTLAYSIVEDFRAIQTFVSSLHIGEVDIKKSFILSGKEPSTVRMGFENMDSVMQSANGNEKRCRGFYRDNRLSVGVFFAYLYRRTVTPFAKLESARNAAKDAGENEQSAQVATVHTDDGRTISLRVTHEIAQSKKNPEIVEADEFVFDDATEAKVSSAIWD